MKKCAYMASMAFICICASGALAAFDDLESGVRALGMGGAYSAVADDADAVYWNPAGLGRQVAAGMTCGVFRPFGMQALQYQCAAFAYPHRSGTYAAALKVFGKSGYYREETAVFSYGRTLLRNIAAGVSLKYMAIRIEPVYGSDWCIGIDGGMAWYPRNGITVAAAIKSMNAPSVSVDSERLPVIISAGTAVRPLKDVVVACDVYRDMRHPVQVRLGQETVLLKYLVVRCGMQSSPARYSAGAGIRVAGFECDYALYGHPVLGVTHQVGVRFSWGRGDAGAGATPAAAP